MKLTVPLNDFNFTFEPLRIQIIGGIFNKRKSQEDNYSTIHWFSLHCVYINCSMFLINLCNLITQIGNQLDDSLADPVQRIVQQTQFGGQCSRSSLEDSVADLVQRKVQKTEFIRQCSRPSLEDSVADRVQKIVK